MRTRAKVIWQKVTSLCSRRHLLLYLPGGSMHREVGPSAAFGTPNFWKGT